MIARGNKTKLWKETTPQKHQIELVAMKEMKINF